uniref:Progestin and adipoQ receptor family member 3 n=1 Tax=Mesocestoides corti TaxID=53468 RepID=A0A5K3EN83_MESCO
CRSSTPWHEEDWYNTTGFIDSLQTGTISQAPSIRVNHYGHAAHYMLHLTHILLWLPAYLPRVLLEHGETENWLRPGGPICLRPNPTPL